MQESTLTSMLKSHMKYMGNRQQVLAQNIANIDTPGYAAKDLKKYDFEAMASAQSGKLAMRTTSPKHFEGTNSGGGAGFRTVEDRKTFETSPTGNNVVLEDQMAKISDTGANYQIDSSLLKKVTQMYRAALGNR